MLPHECQGTALASEYLCSLVPCEWRLWSPISFPCFLWVSIVESNSLPLLPAVPAPFSGLVVDSCLCPGLHLITEEAPPPTSLPWATTWITPLSFFQALFGISYFDLSDFEGLTKVYSHIPASFSVVDIYCPVGLFLCFSLATTR